MWFTFPQKPFMLTVNRADHMTRQPAGRLALLYEQWVGFQRGRGKLSGPLWLTSSQFHRRYPRRLKTKTSCRHHCKGNIISLQIGSVSLVHLSHKTLSKWYHSTKCIQSTAEISFISLDSVNCEHFLWSLWIPFQTVSHDAQNALKFPLTFEFDMFRLLCSRFVDRVDPAQ